MTTYKFPDDVTIEITFNRETITAEGFEWVANLTPDEDDDEYGYFLTYQQNYSGYTLPEVLCKSLIDMDRAEDWDEAISMVEAIGIDYVSSDEEDEGEA